MLTIEFAKFNDLGELKRIAQQFRKELGFVTEPILREGLAEGRIVIAKSGEYIAGFVHFRHRRDLCTKIYQVCVLPPHQRSGIGSAMMEAVLKQARQKRQHCLSLYCPADLDANRFYKAIRFTQAGVLSGKKRNLIEWTSTWD